MTEANARDEFDLGDFAEEQAADVDAAPTLADLFVRAQVAAMEPKPTLKQMIETTLLARYDLEDVQSRLLHAGVTGEPHAPYMRRAAILNAASNFLALIDANQDAVRAVLKKKPKP
jgi:hypothetical protein